jgi:hypothetical protein
MGDHDRAGGDLPVGGREGGAVAAGCQPRHRHPAAPRAAGGQVLEPPDDLGYPTGPAGSGRSSQSTQVVPVASR